MIHNLARRMASVFVLYGESSEENADIYTYACEAIVAFLANVLFGLIISLLFGRFSEGAIFILVFWLLRRYTGGHHAKTHFNCILAFSCILIASLSVISAAVWLEVGNYLSVIIAGLALIGIIIISIKERIKNLDCDIEKSFEVKKQGLWLAFGIFLFCIIDLYIINSRIGLAISLSALSVFGSMAYATLYTHFVKQGGERKWRDRY